MSFIVLFKKKKKKRTKVQVSTYNLKIDINGISDPLEMYKNIISAQILIYRPIRNFIPCSPKVLKL